MNTRTGRGVTSILVVLTIWCALVWRFDAQTFTQVGSSGLPLSARTITNFAPLVMSIPSGGSPVADMQAASAAKFVGQLGVSFPGSKQMNLWCAGQAGSGGSNDWDFAPFVFQQGIQQIGSFTTMPQNSSSGLNIIQNGNAEYSRRFYATNVALARNGSELRLFNMNAYGDGNGLYMPMVGITNQGALGVTPILTNNDGEVVYFVDQFGLTLTTLPYTYFVGETNMAGSYDIITGVGNRIPLYICMNAQIGNEPTLGQKAWVGYDPRGIADSSKPGGQHFQMWIPNVYAFTNPANVDLVYFDQTLTGARVEFETNTYWRHGGISVTNYGRQSQFATGPYYDLSKGACVTTGTNVVFQWDSVSGNNTKGCVWTFDGYTAYRFGIEQKSGDYPCLVHAANAPFQFAQSSVNDLQTDPSAQTLTKWLVVDSSRNADWETASNYFNAIAVHNAAVSGKYGSGSDGAGANLTLTGGKSTGTGRGGAVVLQTTPSATGSGSTLNALIPRTYIAAKTVALTKSSATLVFNVTVATGKTLGVRIFATTRATDNTDFQSIADTVNFAAVNKAGAVTPSSASTVTTANAVSTGTITTTWTAVANGASVDFKCNAVPSLTPAAGALQVAWRIELDTDDTSSTITPQ